MKHLILLVALAAPASLSAETCPPAPDHSAALDRLIAEVQVAPTEMQGRQIANQMWEYWADAPDARAQDMLDEGMRARANYDFATALDAFGRLIEYCPDYAEGYNQRAFVNYLRYEFEDSLVDLDRALDRSPRHIAALAGKGLVLIALGRDDEAQEVLRAAVALNPWLTERHYITEPPGEEL